MRFSETRTKLRHELSSPIDPGPHSCATSCLSPMVAVQLLSVTWCPLTAAGTQHVTRTQHVTETHHVTHCTSPQGVELTTTVSTTDSAIDGSTASYTVMPPGHGSGCSDEGCTPSRVCCCCNNGCCCCCSTIVMVPSPSAKHQFCSVLWNKLR